MILINFSVSVLAALRCCYKLLELHVKSLHLHLIFSVDGVPFLMHDHTLERTTNAEKVFPGRQTDDASHFNWTDLQQLNAGQWFLKVFVADDEFR